MSEAAPSPRARVIPTVVISQIVSSRYAPSHKRPSVWDRRVAGVDTVIASDGKTLKLISDAQQSPPQPGWAIVLEKGDEQAGYSWTLYGLPPNA